MTVVRVVAAIVIPGVLMTVASASESPATGQADPVMLRGHTGEVTTVAWADDGKSLASAGHDRTIRVWNPQQGQQTAIHRGVARDGYGGPVVAFTSDLKHVAVNYWGAISIRSMEDGSERVKIDPILDRGQRSAFRPDVFAMSFSPDGRRLATAGSVAAVGGPHGLPGGIVIVWDAQTGDLIHKSDRLSTAASSVTWSANGKRVAAGTNGAGGELPEPGEMRMWDAESGKVLHSFPVKPKVDYGEWASAADVALAANGERVAVPVTAGSRGTPGGLLIEDTGASVRVWDLPSGESTQPVKGLKASIKRLAFSPDGTLLATASKEKKVRIWAVESGQQIGELASPDRTTVLAFSPDGKSLAAGCRSGSVCVWPVPARGAAK